MRMDQIVIPFQFIPDDAALPDLSGYRDPIVMRVILEPTEQEVVENV